MVTCCERADFLALLYVMLSCVFVTFQYGVLGQMWYLIVSIPDLCLLPINPLCIYIVVCSLQSSPPQYYPSNITTPIAVYSGTADWLVTPSEMKILLPQIKNLVKSVVIDGWEHLDFIWAMDAPQQCYNEVIHMFKNFS